MAAPKSSRADFDSPWKEILELFFPQFMQFFFPDAYGEIDWTKGYKFLDQELQQIVHDAEIGPKRVDKLIEVYLQDGQDAWVLTHIEIQGQKEEVFAKRLYIYNYRLFDRYNRRVATLAVLTDGDAEWRPRQFAYELFKCRISLEFPMVKLLDYRERWAELETSDNPFAIVIMAHLETQITRRKPLQRYDAKLRLAKLMYKRGYNRQTILDLFRFIDWIMTLPTDLSKQFLGEMRRFEENEKMPYVTSVERIGIEKGRQEGLRESIIRVLEVRFGPVSSRLRLLLEQVADVNQLLKLNERAVLTPTLADFEQGLT